MTRSYNSRKGKDIKSWDYSEEDEKNWKEQCRKQARKEVREASRNFVAGKTEDLGKESVPGKKSFYY
jgi:hypothetical protein